MPNDSKDDASIPHTRPEPRPDFSTPIPSKKLPSSLQSTLDNDEALWEALYEGHAPESTDSNVRYAAYATRIRTILLSAHRYVAYTSDIGESFRPVAHPYLVKGAYGVSWAYILGDVANEGYKAYLRNERTRNPTLADEAAKRAEEKEGSSLVQAGREVVKRVAPGVQEAKEEKVQQGKVPAIEDYRAVMAQRAVFQSVASMGLPAFTIHSVVRYSGQALKTMKNQMIRTWAPIGLGLAVVPLLPYMFDEPVEHATEWIFHKAFETIGGPEAVGGRPSIGQQALSQIESKKVAAKEKEL